MTQPHQHHSKLCRLLTIMQMLLWTCSMLCTQALDMHLALRALQLCILCSIAFPDKLRLIGGELLELVALLSAIHDTV